MEMKHSRYSLYLKKTFFSQTKHASQMTLQKLLKTLQVAIVKNLDIFNKCLQQNKFSDPMKKAKFNPIFKKLDNTSKDNYRPISTLSNFTKIFESILFV